MPATVTKTLIVGMDGYEYTLGDKQSQQRADVWTMAKHFGVDEENETLMYIGVVREMVSRYSFSHVQDYETFGDDTPRTLRQWHRAYICGALKMSYPCGSNWPCERLVSSACNQKRNLL